MMHRIMMGKAGAMKFHLAYQVGIMTLFYLVLYFTTEYHVFRMADDS